MSVFRKKIESAGLRPPKSATLMITNGCNLKCSHCWPESCSVESVQPVERNILKRLMHELSGIGTEAICLTGGEPLTHPDWYDILSHACRDRKFKRVVLQTNATLFDDLSIRNLGLVDHNDFVIQVSLDGANALSHDHIRGPGSFEDALKGLQRLCDAGLGRHTQVLFTEMAHNFAELPGLLERVEKLGLAGCVSGTLANQGRARESDDIAPPTPSQYGQLLRLYQTDPAFRSRYERLGNIAAIEWFKGRSHPAALSCACIETPYIDAEGHVYPCLYMPNPEYAAHGAHHRSLEDIILEALPLWADLPRLDRRRRRELKPCQTCPGRKHCAGGCMGRAYTASGNLMSVEDRCALRKSIYTWEASS